MMQVWMHSIPNYPPTLIVGLTFGEIRQLFARPLDIYFNASQTSPEAPLPVETQVPIPMDVILMSTRTKEDIDRHYANSKSVAPLYEPIWHTRAMAGTPPAPVVIVGFAFADLDALIQNPLQFLWEIPGEPINIPFHIAICGGESKEEMMEWFLKAHGITRAPLH
jgi:hypothetical protein